MSPGEIFLARLKRGVTPRAAVGSATSIVTADLMDKVGVSFPAAHLHAEQMAQLAAAGAEVLGFDNVMPLFSVWHESAALGCAVDWGEKTRMPDGRAIYASIDEDPVIPHDFLQHWACNVPLQALKLLKDRFGDSVAVVGKIFGPWTLGYHLYGVEEFLIATLLKPERTKEVMRQLLKVTLSFAEAQIDHGADALTLADHCTRDLCSPDAYRDFLAGIHRELHQRIACPLILHICGDTADRLPYIKETGLDCFHFDSKVAAAEARRLSGAKMALMGGSNNINLIRHGTPEAIENDVREKLQVGIDIIGPECAVPLDAPYENLRRMAEAVKNVHSTFRTNLPPGCG